MKKIGIDARLLNQTGVGTYLKNLLYYLEKILPKEHELNVYLLKEDEQSISFNHPNISKKIAPYRWHSLKEQTGFLRQLENDRLDLMHFTYFSFPYFYSGKFITTIHDLTPWNYKTGKASTRHALIYYIKHFFYKLILTRQISHSLKIIVPTHAVKKDLMKIFGSQLDKKIVVTHEGVNYQLQQSTENEKLKSQIGKDFFLYVGNFYPHKNVDLLLSTFAELKDQRLVLVGPDNFFSRRLLCSYPQMKLIADPSLADLRYLYSHCLALIHPSFSEGFGLPLVEAMSFRKPIIASDIAPFAEITKGKHLAFNPQNSRELKEKIKFLLEQKIVQVDYGDWEKDFAFEKMAKETLKIYQECLS